MEQAGYIAIGLILGMVVGGYGGFKILAASLKWSPQSRDQWAKLLNTVASAEEVQRWRRGEFL